MAFVLRAQRGKVLPGQVAGLRRLGRRVLREIREQAHTGTGDDESDPGSICGILAALHPVGLGHLDVLDQGVRALRMPLVRVGVVLQHDREQGRLADVDVDRGEQSFRIVAHCADRLPRTRHGARPRDGIAQVLEPVLHTRELAGPPGHAADVALDPLRQRADGRHGELRPVNSSSSS